MSESSTVSSIIPRVASDRRPWFVRVWKAYWRSMTRPMSSRERAEASVW